MLRRLFLLLFIFVAWGVNAAQSNIEVVGLFKNTAVVKIDGQRKLLKLNKPDASGAELISADSKSAVIRFAGKEQRYYLGRSIGVQYKAHQAAEVVIKRNRIGQYITPGSINGQGVSFLVDTGATTVAMNENVAKRLGIDYRVNGVEGQAMTASGIARSWMIKVDSVKVGEITVPHVRAAVIEGSAPVHVLLGMTFLDFVKFSEENQTIRLKKKF